MNAYASIELTNSLYLDMKGELRFQNPNETAPHNLSHKARTRINNIEMTTLMQLLTGLDDVQMIDFMATLAMEWLAQHTQSDEQDIYLLMANPVVIGWWRNQWHKRDRSLEGMMVHECGKHLKDSRRLGRPPKECRRLAQMEMMKRYMQLHKMVLKETAYHYRHLEDSYAKLW